MDRRLVKASTTGNVDYLVNLMREETFLLDTVALAEAETPLHIASMRGHLSFVQEMLKLRNQFAYELNQDGFTPLHLASANGHLQVVIELLKVDHNLCSIKGRGETLAVHYAAMKGKVDVMKELLSASPACVEMKTVRGETPLHIAVKNNQFEVFKLLVEHVKTFNKEQVLNEKDNQGNTILHLAASRKQYEVIQFLLVEVNVTKEVVVVNSLNETGMTPLDDLFLFQSEAGDLEIFTTLLHAGAKRGRDISCSDATHNIRTITSETTNENQITPSNETEESMLPARLRYWPRLKELAEFLGYKVNRDKPSDVRNIMLTVAILMATATYQAVLSPPGGLWQDNQNGHVAGTSIFGSKNKGTFFVFMIGNSIGFFTSLYMIAVLTIGFPLQSQLVLSIFALSFTYSSSMYTISPGDRSDRAVFYVFVFFAFFLPYMPSVVGKVIVFSKRCASGNSAA